MTFSIIIPVYNAADYLPQCLDSIKQQLCQDYEVICVNDGSQDNSLDILYQYKQNWANLHIINQFNQGVSSARNCGLKHAKGQYILFSDADDYYYHNHVLSDIEQELIANPDLELIYYPGGVLLADGTPYQQQYEYQLFEYGWQCAEKYCCTQATNVFGSVYCQCFKHDMIKTHHLHFDTHISYGEDRLFVFQYYLICSKTLVMEKPIYCYVTRENSLMTSAKKEMEIDKANEYVALSLYKAIRDCEKSYNEKRNTCKCRLKHSTKCVHNVYGAATKKWNDIDWKFMFQTCSTWKLFIKTWWLVISKILKIC